MSDVDEAEYESDTDVQKPYEQTNSKSLYEQEDENDEDDNEFSDNESEYDVDNNSDEHDNLDENPELANNNMLDNIDNPYNNLELNIDNNILFNDNINTFSKEFKTSYIEKTHSECLHISQDDLSLLTKVTTNNDGIVVDKMHQTLPILTKFEKTKILGIRTKQLNNNSRPYISGSENIKSNYLIAIEELQQKKLPFIIKRPLPNNTYEYWKLSNLEVV
tara:strand:- start:2056 stop:2712 length:657 start_codon:yes stop_codon:yes gene_type:complete